MKLIPITLLAAAAGLIVGCSSNEYATDTTGGAYGYNPGGNAKYVLTLDQLPQPAQIAILQTIAGEPIERIKQENRDGQTVYRVEMQRTDWHSPHPTLLVAADGTFIRESHLPIYEAAGADNSNQARLGALGCEPSVGPSGNAASPFTPLAPTSVLSTR